MKFNFTDTLFALSFALDCVEHDLLGVTTHHSKRVAAICACMGKQLQLSDAQLLDLTACALLHDNALTEYIQSEYFSAENDTVPENEKIKIHCVLGERNISRLPFQGEVSGAVLYHHENADGTGPLGKRWQEIPMYARMIHLADQVDTHFDLSCMDTHKYNQLLTYLLDARDTLFDAASIDCFIHTFPFPSLLELTNENISLFLKRHIPSLPYSYTNEQILDFASVFAAIIDYKSKFTRIHALGIAQKAKQLGLYYGYAQEKAAKLYLAGALHDIGKLVVASEVLEKPDKLTKEEYLHIQGHALATHQILEQIDGLQDIASWASNHHEKLDGSGYPFHKTAADLGFEERMLACLDIYQALTEQRPYKKGMEHAQATDILMQLVQKNQLDATIVQDIDRCFSSTSDEPRHLEA